MSHVARQSVQMIAMRTGNRISGLRLDTGGGGMVGAAFGWPVSRGE